MHEIPRDPFEGPEHVRAHEMASRFAAIVVNWAGQENHQEEVTEAVRILGELGYSEEQIDRLRVHEKSVELTNVEALEILLGEK